MNKKELRLPQIKTNDATQTRALRITYTKKLVDLYNQWNNRLLPSIKRLLGRSNNTGWVKELNEKLDLYSDNTIYANTPRLIKENITLSYKAGKNKAASNPRITRFSIRIDPKLSIYDQRVINDLQTRNMSLITKLTEDIKTKILQITTNGINNGLGTDVIVRDITKNIEDVSKYQVERIVRTELAYSYNTAMSETYKQAGITEWQWLATLGSTCCEECAELHGQVFNWSDNKPPLHPNCLCSLYPVVIND